MSELSNVHRGGLRTRSGACGNQNCPNAPSGAWWFFSLSQTNRCPPRWTNDTRASLDENLQAMEEIGGQALNPKSLKLLWEVTISKEVWKEPLSIIQRKRQPNWCLRRGGSQVSGGGQFTQRVASSTLGRLEHNLRIASFQCPMPKNRRD